MLTPVLLARLALGMDHPMAGTMAVDVLPLSMSVLVLSVLVHSLALLIVAWILAIAGFEIYAKTGLKLLRQAWVTFDLLWAIALLVAGLSILVF